MIDRRPRGACAGIVVVVATCALAGPARGEPAPTEPPATEIDPCADAIVEPVPTPVRDVAIDAQRGACLRDELAAHVQADALIDTPGFHGELGGELRLTARTRIGDAFELDGGLRVTRFTFVQNAVNKVTALQLGPAALGGAWGGRLGAGARVALTALVELPFTRDDQATVHGSGELGVVVTAALGARATLHARLGAVGMRASSTGGATQRLGLRAGADLARRLGTAIAVHGGADVQAGWYGGLDHVNLRAGVHGRFRGHWRGTFGLGFPVGGAERTNVIVDFGLLRDLR